jgi:hypothetical protein
MFYLKIKQYILDIRIIINLIVSGIATGVTNGTLHLGYIAPFMRFGFAGNDLNATVPSFTTVNTEPFRVWSFLYNSFGRFIYLDGTLQSSDANRISLITTQSGLIGSNAFGVATPLYNGNISEIIFTKPSIDGFVRQQTEGYLAWKWGLQANLPASHPFKNAPPQ